MEKIWEPFTSLIGEKISASLNVNDNVQALKEKSEVLQNKAIDIEDKVKRAEQSGQKKRTREVGSFLKTVKKLKVECDQLNDTLGAAGFIQRLWLGSHVKKLKERVEEFSEQSEAFHELVLDTVGSNRERLFTTELHGESWKQELDNVLAQLESGEVQIFGIYGMGGVGKTTLANHVYKYICNNLQGAPDRYHVFWVTVSQNAGINKLQYDLAKKLKCDLPEGYDEQEKAAILHKELRDMGNVVLILDDVWQDIDLRQIGIPIEANRCKVIITSRLQEVCNRIGCKEIIKVEPLSEQEAWALFLEKLDCVRELSPEVEKVAKTVAKKCKGLPLGIITLARSMSGVYDIHDWRYMLEELNSSIEQNEFKSEVFSALRTSFDRLSSPKLQLCFLYCSLYPEDFEIPVNELISTFIYEEMMRQMTSRAAAYDQGHALLNKLVNACLLESFVNFFGEKCVKMHDLLREMAVEITRNNSRFMTKAGLQLHKLPDWLKWREDLEKVSFMKNKISEVPEGSSPKCPRLSTLILRMNPLVIIPDSFFAHMRRLRVLDLRRTDIEKLPNSISDLENLTALLLGGCQKLYYVPSLRKLVALMELDISRTEINVVPDGMEHLVKLKCLNMHMMRHLIEFPKGLLPQLSHLECLRLPLNTKITAEEVESLKLLEEFHGWIHGMLKLEWLSKSPTLSFYNILLGCKRPFLVVESRYRRTIVFKEFDFETSRDVVPQNIESIHFSGCKGLSDCLLDSIPFMYLKQCVIEECNEIESIMRSSASSNLERLYLDELENFIGWFKWEKRAQALPPRGTFSSLRLLSVQGCHKMKILFPHKLLANNLGNLEKIIIRSCHEMKEIIADNEEEDIITFPKLTMIELVDLPQLEIIGAINCCDSIESIRIIYCPKLERVAFSRPSVDENPTIPFQLRRIEIQWCKQLRRLPLYLPLIDGQPSPPPSLEDICIRVGDKKWWESLEWDHPDAINVLSPFLRFRW